MIRALSKVQAKSRKKRLPSRMRELKELRAIVIYRGKEPVELIPANPNLPALKPRRLRADEQYWPLRLSRDDILGLRDFSRQNEEEQTSILEELEDILRHLRDASKHRPLVKKDEKGDMPCVYLYKDKHLIDLYCSGDGPFLLEQLYRRQQH
jgi:hypothetical protein